jgi:hypothetical protein
MHVRIEDALEAAGIRYDRLDGTMKRDDRTRAMDALKHDPGCEVLLVSLKAGGVGLNLTAAQRVYLMDPYWNPAVENQAVDRIVCICSLPSVRRCMLTPPCVAPIGTDKTCYYCKIDHREFHRGSSSGGAEEEDGFG